jgi:hypothetical protein
MENANTPAVALAAPTDSGTGSSSGGSSPSSSSHDSGSTSSDASSAKTAESAPNDPASHHPRPRKPRGAVNKSERPLTGTTTGSSASAETTALAPSTSTSSTGAATTPPTLDAPGTDAPRSDRLASRPASGSTSLKTSPNPLAVNAPTFDAAARASRLDAVRVVPAGRPSVASTTPSAAAIPVAAFTAAPTSSSAAPAEVAPAPASTVISPTPADPLRHLVTTLINAVLSPFANSAPTTPVQLPAAWTLLAFARREFGQASAIPSTTVNPLAGQTTTGLVTDTVGSTSDDATLAVDPGFISSTRSFFGLFSITSAGDPDDDNYVAFVFESPFFTFVLTSGTDPEDNLGFGAASIGRAGHTVGTFISPFLNFSIAIPIEDPFAELFIALIRAGLV